MSSQRLPAHNNIKIHMCLVCSWFRMLSNQHSSSINVYEHPLYGLVTYGRAAELDIQKHSCVEHELAKQRLGRGSVSV